MSTETLAEIIPYVFASLMSGVHTAIPGKIESYDRDKFRAKVTPLVSHITLKNQEIEVPSLTDVPVMMFGGSTGIIDIELVKDDNVLLIFSESGIGGWKSSTGKKQVAPDNISHHERSDAIAIPCLVPDGQLSSFSDIPRITIDTNGDVSMVNSGGDIILSSNGQVQINGHFTVDP